MKNIQKVAVLGGSGKTGKFLVNQLLEKGFSIKLLLRNPENYTTHNSKIEIVKGDALDFESIKNLLQNCQAVISVLGQRKGEPLTALKATTNILKVMEEYAIKRYILLAGLNVDTPFDEKTEKTLAATNWMKLNFPDIQEDRQKAYDVLVESNADWTLVRVPFIEFLEVVSPIEVNLKDCTGEKIDAGSIAAFMVEQLEDINCIKEAPFIASIS